MTFPPAVRSSSDSAARTAHEERENIPMTDIHQPETSPEPDPTRDLENGSYTEMEGKFSTTMPGAHVNLNIFNSIEEELEDEIP